MNRSAMRHAVALAATGALFVAFGGSLVRGQSQQQNPQRNAPAAKAAAPAAPAAPEANAASPQTPAQGESEPNVDPNKVVLTVGNEKVTAGQIDALVKDLPAQQQQLLRRAGKRMLADELMRIKLFSQEAQKRQLDKNPKIQRQLELTRDQILANALAGDVLRQTYESNKEKFQKIQARHILIRTPGSRAPVRPGQKELTEQEAKAKAEDIRKQLVGGADFAELARKESDDVSSGAEGGNLNAFGHGEMVPEFDKAAFAMKEGEISQPVKTQFGYHIIQVQNILGFDQLQQDIAQQSNPQIQKLVEDLKKNTPVQMDESYFGPAPSAAAPANAPPGAGSSAPGAVPAGGTGTTQPPQPGQGGKR